MENLFELFVVLQEFLWGLWICCVITIRGEFLFVFGYQSSEVAQETVYCLSEYLVQHPQMLYVELHRYSINNVETLIILVFTAPFLHGGGNLLFLLVFNDCVFLPNFYVLDLTVNNWVQIQQQLFLESFDEYPQRIGHLDLGDFWRESHVFIALK